MAERASADTPYGPVEYSLGSVGGVEVLFIPRHGFGHRYPPHRVPYHANLYLARAMGARWVIGTSAVGSLREEIRPGTVVIPDDLIDYTRGRRYTFYDDRAVHVDFTKPYCETLSRILYEACAEEGVEARLGGTYVCTEGPRFETPAEIRMFRALGADIVGMTNVPEAVLARELALHYSALCMVTNYAAGMQARVTQEEVYRMMEEVRPRIVGVLGRAVRKISMLGEVRDYCIEHEEDARSIVGGGVR